MERFIKPNEPWSCLADGFALSAMTLEPDPTEAEIYVAEVASAKYRASGCEFLFDYQQVTWKWTNQDRLSARSSPTRQQDPVLQLVGSSALISSLTYRKSVGNLDYEDRGLNGE